MGILQNEFDRVLEDQCSASNLTKLAVRHALKQRNPQLTEERLTTSVKAISAAILEAKEGTINLSFEMEGESPDKRIEIDDSDLQSALQQVEDKFSSNITKVITQSIDEMSPSVLSRLYASASEALRHRHKQQRLFEKRLRNRWKEGIDRLEMLVMIAQEAGGIFLQDVQRAHEQAEGMVSREELCLLDALVRIHVRSCRIACEVLCLLKGGFADGANARWRSLHENAVIAMFIVQCGGDVAERYLAHSAVERYRAAQQYQQHSQALGEEPLDDTELNELAQAQAGLVAKYGNDFRNEYGWAANALGYPAPRFADIERHLDMSRWRPYYKMACHSVHAGAQGLYFLLAVTEPTEPTLLAGASNAGLCDPGHSTAISLTMVSAAMFTAKANIDSLVTAQVMTELCDHIGDAFLNAHHKLVEDARQGHDLVVVY